MAIQAERGEHRFSLDYLAQSASATEMLLKAAERNVREVLRAVHTELSQALTSNGGEDFKIPSWMEQRGDGAIIVHPCSPFAPATALGRDGTLASVNSAFGGVAKDTSPLSGLAYLTTARQMFPFLKEQMRPGKRPNSHEVLA